MQYFESVAESASGNETVDARANRQSFSSGGAVELDCVLEDGTLERGLDDRKSKHCIPSNPKGPLFLESLEDFLDDREARDDLLGVDHAP